MYIAQRTIIDYDRSGKKLVYKPGDEVIGFESWNHSAKHYHIEKELVKLVEAKPAQKKAAPKRKPREDQCGHTAETPDTQLKTKSDS